MKKKMPTTPDGFKKRLSELSKNEIKTPEQAQEFALLMLGSIDLEMKRLQEYIKDNENQLAQELLDRYKQMRDNWQTRLKYVEKKLK